jgi:nucleoside-diphosphate-sugar epimerase
MRVLLAGGSGVSGRQATPLLRAAAHDVYELVRPDRIARADDTRVVVVNVFDPVALASAARKFSPDAVVSLLTAIPRRLSPRILPGTWR